MGIIDELKEITHVDARYDEQMKKHTGYGVGGKAKIFVRVDSLYTLNLVLTLIKKHKEKFRVIGNGSNILFSDNDYDGVIISLLPLNEVFFKRDKVKAMAGAKLEKLINFTYENNLTGLEALSGIPATIGGAVCMNAGAFGKNISDHIETVETLVDGKIKVYDKNECDFSYRRSRFLHKNQAIVSATFSFMEGDKLEIKERIKTYLDLRKNLLPTGKSCGSVFKNPKNVSAGRLIDLALLKGYSIGGAKISEKHGNFIITESGAKAQDVYALIKDVKSKIKDKYNIELNEEIEYIGEFN